MKGNRTKCYLVKPGNITFQLTKNPEMLKGIEYDTNLRELNQEYLQESKQQVKSLRQGNTKILEKRKLQMNSSFNVEFTYCDFTIKALEGFMEVTSSQALTWLISKYIKSET